MRTTITFNTGRLYSANGQLVTAEFDTATGLVKYIDHSRLIEGQFRPQYHVYFAMDRAIYEQDWFTFARSVMRVYDGGSQTELATEWDHWITGDRPVQQQEVWLFRL